MWAYDVSDREGETRENRKELADCGGECILGFALEREEHILSFLSFSEFSCVVKTKDAYSRSPG